MLGRLGYLFICFLWLLQSTEVLAVSKDKKPILIICSYNPAAHQTSVTISDYMDEYSKLGGQRDIIIENVNRKSVLQSFCKFPASEKNVMKQKYQKVSAAIFHLSSSNHPIPF